MWTYKFPYREPLTASERIQYHAHAELFRAMNIGRQVAFVGSGVSTAFGQLTWDEMTLLTINAVDQEYRNQVFDEDGRLTEWKPLHSSADRLHSSLREQLGKDSLHNERFYRKNINEHYYYYYSPINATYSTKIDNTTTILALCTDLAKALGNGLFVKEFVASLFKASPLELFLYRLSLLQGQRKGTAFYRFFCKANLTSILGKYASIPDISSEVESHFVKKERNTGISTIEKLRKKTKNCFL